MSQLCALAGVTRQAFYKRDEDALLARLAIEQFVVQYVLEVRVKDPKIGMDKLWRMYSAKFPEEYRVGRDVFRSILHERGLNLRHRPRAIRTTDSRHNLPTYPNPFRQRVNVEYSGQQPITAAYLTDIMGRTEPVTLNANGPGRYTLDLTSRPQAAYLLTLVTHDGHRHTVRLLKQSEVFGQ